MKEQPIIFSGPMVQALLGGRKTQTRRVITKKQHRHHEDKNGRWQECELRRGQWEFFGDLGLSSPVRCPYGVPGDVLWVRETFAFPQGHDVSQQLSGKQLTSATTIWYRAGGKQGVDCDVFIGRWRSPYHMPRWASRILLNVKRVWVERVRDISGADVIAEGILGDSYLEEIGTTTRDPHSAAIYFMDLWDSINKSRGFGWDSNPWVWALEFERVDANTKRLRLDVLRKEPESS